MQNSSQTEGRSGLLLSLFVLGLVTVLAILPTQLQWEVSSQESKGGLIERTESHEPGLENYDIRGQKSEEVENFLIETRNASGKTASAIADTREGFVRGEQELRSRVPSLKVEYNTDIRTPEVIGPDVAQGRNFLTPAATGSRAEMLRSFVKQNESLIGIGREQADLLKVRADYTNPDGNLSFVHFDQEINGIPVFRGEIKAGFTKNSEIIRVINNLAPSLDYESLSTDFRDPLDAVKAAAGYINNDMSKLDLTRNDSVSTDIKVHFGQGDWATTAEKMYFPTEPGVAVPAWRVLIWQPVNAYYVIVDTTGRMLWRKNITEDQTTAATYQVYTTPTAMINLADSPAPLSPGPIDPALGTQAPVGTRVNVTLIGNEAPYTFNNNGWITDGGNSTDGNYNESGIDRVAPNGVDAPQPGDGACPGAGCRVFSSAWNPPPGNPAPGDDPLTPVAQRGAVIQMFYAMNRYQSEMYRLGFTEQAFNFQNDNFGRGGVAGDRVSAEGQDSSGTNNANFSTPADGGRGRMQMFLWTGPTPDYDGTADADIIIHEVTHGLSNRLHGNASGLSTNMARGMGEGWSDYYAHAMLSEPTDPANGIYSLGGYATHLAAAGFTGNYYFGIRRYPKAPIAFTGGANNKPHNAYVFSDINAGCATRFTNANFAFARGPFGVAQCDAVHNAGEIWSSALWEVRTNLVSRLGWADGNRKALQYVTDGMKLAPLAPTMLTERDAILAATLASGTGADVADTWAGFAVRGMGFGASIQAISPASVTADFGLPNAVMVDPFTVSDAPGDGDGFPEPGEDLLLSVAVTNNTGGTVTNVTAAVTGGATGNYGDIANGQTVVRQIAYTVPGGAVCGAMHEVTVTVASSIGINTPQMRSFRLGEPLGGAPATFANSTPIDVPAGQPTTTSGPASPYPSNINVTGVSGNKLIKITFNNLRHEFLDDIDMLLVGPGGQKYIFLSDVGGSTEQLTPITISVADNGDNLLPDNAPFINGTTYRPSNVGANDPFDPPAPGTPYENAAPAGSATFASVFGTDGAAMNGTWSLYIDDDAGSDPGRIENGWAITFESDDYACSLVPATGNGRADFDGDGRTDVSVFRGSEGNWYLNQSTAGFSALNWGVASDVIVPADYDGDGKTDIAVFRGTTDPGQSDFYILNSNGFTVSGASWGLPGDIPVSSDYDGDGKADIGVYRPSDGTWYVLLSSNGGNVIVSNPGSTPVPGDYDGDGQSDGIMYTNGTWIGTLSGGPAMNVSFGQVGDIPVPGDFDGDGKVDHAIYRPSTGTWWWLSSADSIQRATAFGVSTDIPVPGDYDGDGKDDFAIYRNGVWWINGSTAGVSQISFGIATDNPIVNAARP